MSNLTKQKLKSTLYLIVPFLLLGFIASMCVPDPKRLNSNKPSSIEVSSKGYSVLFYSIDNYALVYVDNLLVSDTRDIGDPEEEKVLDLNKFISVRSKKLRVEIYNLACTSCRSNTWSVTYGIYKDGIETEYVGESSNGQQAEIGHVFTKEHLIN